MKAEVEKPCKKCGSNVFYVYDSRRQCVACRDRWAQTYRQRAVMAAAEANQLRAEVERLRGMARIRSDT